MERSCRRAALVSALVLVGAPETGVSAQEAPLHHLAWLAGCWHATSGGALVEEQWMRPRGGLMPGMSRTVRDGLAASWEFMRIEARQSGVYFLAQPLGGQSVEFRAVELTDSAAVFENHEHDFPQRIIYRHTPDDALHARIEDARSRRGIDFVYTRTACAPNEEAASKRDGEDRVGTATINQRLRFSFATLLRGRASRG